MISILVSWAILTVAILIVASVLPGVKVKSLATAIVAAAVLGILNALVGPILLVLTLPITLITLGLFIFVINALLFWLAGALVPNFEVRSFWSALGGSIIVSIVSYLVNVILR